MNRTKLRTAELRVILTIAALTTTFIPAMRAAEPGGALGSQRRWTLDFRVRLEQPGGERPIEIGLGGDWVSTIIAMRPGEYDSALQVANPRLRGDGVKSAPAGANEQLQARLSGPFWATYRNDGALLAVHFFKDVTPGDRNLLQMIATATQLVRPDPFRPLWTVLERDGAGSYLAIYQRQELNRVLKRKLKYVYTDGVAGAPVDGMQVAVDQSELRFSLDAEGGIVTLDGSDQVKMGVSLGDAGELTAITETHFANLRRSQAPELIGSLARALPNVVSSAIVTQRTDPEHDRVQRDARLIEGRTTESLFEAASAEQGDPMLVDRLAAMFRRRPETVATALTLMRKNGSGKRIARALASAGSPAALEALGSLALDRTGSLPARVDALTAFVLVQHPSAQVMRVPLALLDDADVRIESAARITSGALANAGRAAHPDEAAAIDAALIARYRKAWEVRELSDLLAAFGNSVGNSVLPLIKDALRDSREPVRAAAARALRLASGPEIDGLLSVTITGDQDPGVRAAAIFATSFRHPIGPRIGEALVSVAKADPAAYVRSGAISLLRQNPDASPHITETLAWIAEHDAKPGLRRLAREALSSDVK